MNLISRRSVPLPPTVSVLVFGSLWKKLSRSRPLWITRWISQRSRYGCQCRSERSADGPAVPCAEGAGMELRGYRS